MCTAFTSSVCVYASDPLQLNFVTRMNSFPTIVAACEAARLTGWERTEKAIKSIWEEAQIILQENKKDDTVDADGDGVADVNQLEAKDLMFRKAHLVMTKCDPEKINAALGGECCEPPRTFYPQLAQAHIYA